MRCKACNAILSDTELLIKDPDGEFEDMCIKCLTGAEVDNEQDYRGCSMPGVPEEWT